MASRLLLLLLLVAACARTTTSTCVVDSVKGHGTTAEMDFWDGLAAQRTVSNDDALYALLLQYGGVDKAGDFDARVKAARDRGWIGAQDGLVRNETARVGWIAKAVCIENGIKGGVTMRVFGPSERYAVQELNFREWLPGMSRRQAVSGAVLIALFSKAEDETARATPEPREDF